MGAGTGKARRYNRKELVEGKTVKMDEAVNFGGIGRMLADLAQGPAQAAAFK